MGIIQFNEFLSEVNAGQIEIAATKVFPADSVYSTTYNDEDYVVVNFTDPDQFDRYLPFAWAVVRTMVQSDNFSFVAFIGADRIGTMMYITDKLNQVTAAKSNPDGSDASPAAVKIIAALRKEKRVHLVQNAFESADVEDQVPEPQSDTQQSPAPGSTQRSFP